jgi:ubiquitin-conjugating enzyme E2 variant
MRTLLFHGTLAWLLTAVAVCSFALEAIAVLLLVDLASGFFHWLEDTFWTEKTPVLGRWVVTPNVLHHRSPGAFVDKSWLESSWDLVAFGACIVGVASALHCLTWQVWLFAIVGANANQIHKWTHLPRHRLPWAVRELQQMGVLQSAADHAAHHRGEKNTAYCVITPWVNPVLDQLGIWRGLERLVVRGGAAPRRPDLAAPHGEGTASAVRALLIVVLVLGLGPGCSSPGARDPNPRIVRVIAGGEAAGAYVRASAAALPVSRGLPCPTSSSSLDGGVAPASSIPGVDPLPPHQTNGTSARRSSG